MTATAESLPALAERLAALLERARGASFQAAGPVLASLTTAVDPAFHPLRVGQRRDYFLWEQPARGFALAGIGQAARLAGHGARRFASTRADLQRLLAEAVIERPQHLDAAPIALAGFAFDPATAAEAAWRSFPDALVLLPRFLFARSGDEAWLTVNVIVDRRL